MDYFTLKSEVYVHFSGIAQEYFRYEIVTRSWIADNDENMMEWQSHVHRLDRNGAIREINITTGSLDSWWEGFDFSVHRMSRTPYVDLRNQIAENHARLVRHAMG